MKRHFLHEGLKLSWHGVLIGCFAFIWPCSCQADGIGVEGAAWSSLAGALLFNGTATPVMEGGRILRP